MTRWGLRTLVGLALCPGLVSGARADEREVIVRVFGQWYVGVVAEAAEPSAGRFFPRRMMDASSLRIARLSHLPSYGLDRPEFLEPLLPLAGGTALEPKSPALWRPSCPDSDGDGVCERDDRCPGFDDRQDADGDGVPDGCDLCTGNDATGDSDGDGTCDDLDLCLGDDRSGDLDSDGTCFDRDCNDGDPRASAETLHLTGQVIDAETSFGACGWIVAGDGLRVASTGRLLLVAGGGIALSGGFSVDSNGLLTAQIDSSLQLPSAFWLRPQH